MIQDNILKWWLLPCIFWTPCTVCKRVQLGGVIIIDRIGRAICRGEEVAQEFLQEGVISVHVVVVSFLCIKKRISDQQDERRDQQECSPCDQIKPERRAGKVVAQKHHTASLGYRAICVLVLTHKNAASAWWNPISS